MNVIFLDVDGVLNSVRSCIAWHQEYKSMFHHGGDCHDPVKHRLRNHIDPIAVKLINRVTEEFDIKFVISSTHRKHIPDRNLVKMQKYFDDFGLTADVIGFTPDSPSGHRGTEISHWLGKHPEVDIYAIIDDSSDMEKYQLPFFVHTSTEEGFSFMNYKQLRRIFNADEPELTRDEESFY